MEWSLDRLRPRSKISSTYSESQKNCTVTTKKRKRQKCTAKNNVKNEDSNEILTKTRFLRIVREIIPKILIDEPVEKMLIEMTESFVESIVNGASLLAKHRKGITVEINDVKLYLCIFSNERSYHKYKKLITTKDTERIISVHKILDHYE